MYTVRLHLRIALLIATTGLALVAAGVASAGGSCHEAPTEDSTTTVELSALCFSPTVAHVDVGSSVEFVNLDAFGHNVVGLGVRWGQFESISPGDSVVAGFDTPGIHPFSCTLHPGMVGAIVVGDVAASSQAITEAGRPGVGVAVAAVLVVGGGAAIVYERRSSRRRPETIGDA